jgi:ABC-type nitrate/sulfonate/bicarbonate transport system substrate-binding protein
LLRALRGIASAATFALAATVFATTVSAQNLIPLRVANFQNTVVLPLYYGIEKGYFKEAGLNLELVRVATGAASVSAVASGQADIGWAAATVPIFARSNGVKVKIFMTADQEGPPDYYGTFMVASTRSGVTAINQLKGKTIAINAFGTATELAFRDRLQKAGTPWDEVKKVVIPFPQMPAALELGHADVVVTIQPMYAAIAANKAIGARLLDRGTLTLSATQAVTASSYFARDEWLAKNENAALAFGRAYLRAQKELHASRDLRIEHIIKAVGMDRATAETIPEAWFETLAVRKEAVAPNYETLLRTGMITNAFPIDDVILTLPY